MNQTDVHATEKSDRACARRLRRDYADEIRALMFFEDQRRNVRQVDLAVDDGELNMRIIFCDLLHDRRLREANADDQIEISFCKGAHRRFDRVRRSWFDIAQDNRKMFRSAFHTLPRGGVERTVVLATDVKHNADVNL